VQFFRVQLHGRGIALVLADAADPAIGFHCYRDVRAADPMLAQQVAVAKVLDEWRCKGAYVSANRGGVPTLHVEGCWSIGFWRGVLGRTAGYTFYSQED
jgi:hypothetical protein